MKTKGLNHFKEMVIRMVPKTREELLEIYPDRKDEPLNTIQVEVSDLVSISLCRCCGNPLHPTDTKSLPVHEGCYEWMLEAIDDKKIVDKAHDGNRKIQPGERL